MDRFMAGFELIAKCLIVLGLAMLSPLWGPVYLLGWVVEWFQSDDEGRGLPHADA